MKSVKAALLLSTFPDRVSAEKCANILLEEHLIACANILEKVHSLFWWKGKITRADEVLFLAKTRFKLAEQVIQKMRQYHPYECPEIVLLEISQGNANYLEWIAQETVSGGEHALRKNS